MVIDTSGHLAILIAAVCGEPLLYKGDDFARTDAVAVATTASP